MEYPHSSGALNGLKVLDLTRVRAGPTCVRVLADFGADVIKIEPPAGFDSNEGMSGARSGYDMQNLHRNKRCMTLNLKSETGRAVFSRMVAQSDVVVENFRPDVKKRLGIAYDDLAKINPRIILASISGFGQSGPHHLRGGFDQIAQGMGGLMWLTGLPGQGPVRAGIALADSSSGLYAALGILIALRERDASGLGQWVHTSLLEAQIAMLDFQAARYLMDGVVPQQAGNDHPYVTPMGVFQASDGFFNIGVAGDGLWRRFCDTIKRPDWLEDTRFATDPDRLEHRPELNSLLAEIFIQRPACEWIDLFDAAGIPAGPIHRMNEVFDDPQVQHLEMGKTARHPERGEISLVRQPVSLSRTPASIVSTLPDIGFNNREILEEFGFGEEEIAAFRKGRVI